MLINGFALQVPEGKETAEGYVALQHAQKYSLRLTNNKGVKCNATVKIDGEEQGSWRIEAYDSIVLKRPATDSGNFTFYKLESSEGNAIGLQANSDLGLVSVTFIPEKIQQQNTRSVTRSFNSSLESFKGVSRSYGSGQGFSAGGSGLSGESGQTFGRAKEIQLDYEQETVITLRLVSDDNNDDNQPRPLPRRSNPVPPSLI